MDQELTSHALGGLSGSRLTLLTIALCSSERRADVKWRHGYHLKDMTLHRKSDSDSVNRCVFTWRTILPNFIPIRFETTEPCALFEERRPNKNKDNKKKRWVAIWDQCSVPDPEISSDRRLIWAAGWSLMTSKEARSSCSSSSCSDWPPNVHFQQQKIRRREIKVADWVD